MVLHTVWIVDPDAIFRQEAQDTLRRAGLEVMVLENVTRPWPWKEQDTLIIPADLLPAQRLPATVVALVTPGDAAAQVKALQSKVRWSIPRDPSWLPYLPAILAALQAGADYPEGQEICRPAVQRAKELASLRAMVAHVSQSLELEDVLEAAMEEIGRVLGVEACTISLVNETAGELLLCAQRGLHFSHLGMCMPLEQSLFGRVARTGDMAFIGNINRDPRLAMSDLAREQVGPVALVPMHSRGKVVGVLSAMGHSLPNLTIQEIAQLQVIADQVGTAVENAQLYQALKEHSASLEEAYARLQETDKMKDELIQNVSHELRTPLTILNGHVQLLLEGEMGELLETQRKSLDIVARKAKQLGRLVADVVTLEAVSPETLGIALLDLGQLARAAVEGYRPTATAAGVELREEIPDGLPQALADGTRITQVLDNLLANALKFSHSGGTIIVRVKEEGRWLWVGVSDTGIGIPTEKLPRLFDRFYQVDGSIRRRYGGMGLGLSIVKHIVEAHGGQVGVESKLGEGSTFYFILPKVD
jgi:signal transduction histidine kinase